MSDGTKNKPASSAHSQVLPVTGEIRKAARGVNRAVSVLHDEDGDALAGRWIELEFTTKEAKQDAEEVVQFLECASNSLETTDAIRMARFSSLCHLSKKQIKVLREDQRLERRGRKHTSAEIQLSGISRRIEKLEREINKLGRPDYDFGDPNRDPNSLADFHANLTKRSPKLKVLDKSKTQLETELDELSQFFGERLRKVLRKKKRSRLVNPSGVPRPLPEWLMEVNRFRKPPRVTRRVLDPWVFLGGPLLRLINRLATSDTKLAHIDIVPGWMELVQLYRKFHLHYGLLRYDLHGPEETSGAMSDSEAGALVKSCRDNLVAFLQAIEASPQPRVEGEVPMVGDKLHSKTAEAAGAQLVEAPPAPGANKGLASVKRNPDPPAAIEAEKVTVKIDQGARDPRVIVDGKEIRNTQSSALALIAIYYLWSEDNQRQSMVFRNEAFGKLRYPYTTKHSAGVDNALRAIQRELGRKLWERRGCEFSISYLEFDKYCLPAKELKGFLEAKAGKPRR